MLGQRHILALCSLIVLHEDVIPNFNVLTATATRRTRLAARFLTRINEHFGIRTARTRGACRPPPVIFATLRVDVIFRNTLFLPVSNRLIITRNITLALKNRHRKLRRIKAKMLRQELKAPSNRFLLKIVAQRPVAEHFKEGQVCAITHRLNIARTNALLHIRQTRTSRMLFTQEIRHQRMHACRGKQNSRVIFRNHRSTRNNRMPLRFEKLQIHLTQCISSKLCHNRISIIK